MNRNTRTIAVIAVAVVTAGLATLGVYSALKRIPERQVEVAHLYIVAASRSLPTGSLVQADHVKLVAWPQRNPVPGTFTSIEDVIGRGLIASVHQNEPLTESKLAPREAGAGLPPSIPQGMRAMSVKVNEVIGVAGFVVPGTRVDVLAIVREGRDNNTMTRAVVSNAQVLTAGTRYDQEKSRDGEPIPSTVVTLMVTPDDAERIALASSEGRIMLTLRNPLDMQPTETRGVRMTALMAPANPPPVETNVGGRRVMAPRPPAQAPPVSSIYTVEAIRAAKRTEEVVR
jgi:pilus assembly protein CpaB